MEIVTNHVPNYQFNTEKWSGNSTLFSGVLFYLLHNVTKNSMRRRLQSIQGFFLGGVKGHLMVAKDKEIPVVMLHQQSTTALVSV